MKQFARATTDVHDYVRGLNTIEEKFIIIVEDVAGMKPIKELWVNSGFDGAMHLAMNPIIYFKCSQV